MKNKIVFIASILGLSFDQCFAGAPSCINNLRKEASDEIVLKRTFARMEAEAITITEADLKNAYSFGKLEITNVYTISANQNVDVGSFNTTNAQNWSITGQNFTRKDTALIINPNATPHFSAFPNANIALKEYKNYASCSTCDDYSFFSFRKNGIYFDGESYLDKSTTTNSYQIDTLNFLLADLQVSINSDFVVKDTIDQSDTLTYLDGYIRAEGFGTITALDGTTYNVIKTVNLIKERKGTVTKATKYINFFSNTGYSLTLFLSDTTVINGIAKVSNMEEKYIAANPLSIESIKSENTNFKLYPSPANDKLYIETDAQTTNVSIYDRLGREIIKNVYFDSSPIMLSISDLEKGLYFVFVNNQKAKLLKE